MLNFDIDALGRKLGGWDDKDRQAAKYKSSDSDYRTYKPRHSGTPDGELYLTMKIDHIRGMAQDDHANVELWIGPDGQFSKWRVKVAIAGNPKFDTGLVTAAAALVSAKAAGIAFVVASIVNSLSDFMATVTDHGGRAHFPGVVQWNMYKMSECLSGAESSQAGPIADKYAAFGGSGGLLGEPVYDEAPTANNDGRYRNYRDGTIFWSQRTGAFEVHGEILKKYGAFGFETGFLGYPITDESPCLDGSGRYNHFEGGSIFWHPSTGAFEVHGSIRDHYASIAWERSPLGYPLSDEKDLPKAVGSVRDPASGRYNKFQHGYLCWTQEKGVWQTDELPRQFRKLAEGVLVGGASRSPKVRRKIET